jgi:hypothetical protein
MKDTMTLENLLKLIRMGKTYHELMAACADERERRAVTKILLHAEREGWSSADHGENADAS